MAIACARQRSSQASTGIGPEMCGGRREGLAHGPMLSRRFRVSAGRDGGGAARLGRGGEGGLQTARALLAEGRTACPEAQEQHVDDVRDADADAAGGGGDDDDDDDDDDGDDGGGGGEGGDDDDSI